MTTATAATFSSAQIAKATKLINARRIHHVEDTREYLSTASDGVTRYITDAYRQTCTCPAGNHGLGCYHLCAALALDTEEN